MSLNITLLKFATRSPPVNQRGVGLIEVMVAVLILGVGLLGILTMQKTSLQYNQNAYFYSQANILMHDLTEKVRANKTASSRYSFSFGGSGGGDLNRCISAACSPNDLADWDTSLWLARVDAIFPAGEAEADVKQAGEDSASRISIRFTPNGESSEPQTVSLEFRI